MRDYFRLILFVYAYFAAALAADAVIRAAWSVPRGSIAPLVLGMAAAVVPVEAWLRWKGGRKRRFDLTWGDKHPLTAAALLAGGIFLFGIALALVGRWLIWDGLAWSAAVAGAAFVVLFSVSLLVGSLRRRQARRLGVPVDEHRYELPRRARRPLIALAVIAGGLVVLLFVADLVADIEG